MGRAGTAVYNPEAARHLRVVCLAIFAGCTLPVYLDRQLQKRFRLVTTPNIFELLRGVKWISFHFWSSLHNFFVPIAAWLAAASRRWINRHNARPAQNWPPVDGRVQSTDVVRGAKSSTSAAPVHKVLSSLQRTCG